MNRKLVLFVDPMSYNNLALYDYNLLLNIKDMEVIFACNCDFDLSIPYLTYRIFSYNQYGVFGKPLSYMLSMLKVIAISVRKKVDIVHFQWFKIPLFDYLVIKVLNSLNIKVIYTAHNVLPHDSGLKYKRIYKVIYNNVEKIICHTEHARLQLEEMFALMNTVVIPHGLLNLDMLNSQVDIDANIISKFEGRHDTVFSFVGNISTYKGIDIVIDAWLSSDLLRNSNATLLIAGAGRIPNLDAISACANVLIFNRQLTNSEFLYCIEKTDFVLMPYRTISQSGLLLTALAKNKRIIVSNLPPLVEPFEFISNDLGCVLKENNSNILKEKLEEILIKKHKEILLSKDVVKKFPITTIGKVLVIRHLCCIRKY